MMYVYMNVCVWVCVVTKIICHFSENVIQSTHVTERTPPYPQTDWLINDSREIIKENSYIFLSLFFLSFHFLSYFIYLFLKLLTDVPRFVKVNLTIKKKNNKQTGYRGEKRFTLEIKTT